MPNFQTMPTMAQTPVNTINPVAPLQTQQVPVQFGQFAQPMQQPQQFFLPQPAGSVYTLNTSSEIGNVPTGAAMSVGICLNEGTLYIKTLQNNNPVLLAYRLTPLEEVSQAVATTQPVIVPQTANDEYVKLNDRLARIEERLFAPSTSADQKGGRQEWQL